MESLAVNLPRGFDGVEEACVAPVKKRKLISVTTPFSVVAKATTPTRKIYAEAVTKVDSENVAYFFADVYEIDAYDERTEICSVDFHSNVGSCRVTRILRGIVCDLRRYYQHRLNNKANRAAKVEAAHA